MDSYVSFVICVADVRRVLFQNLTMLAMLFALIVHEQISVLHGPPGTGKTLTAEGVAELLKRPLYMLGASELSLRPDEMERSLIGVLSVRVSFVYHKLPAYLLVRLLLICLRAEH